MSDGVPDRILGYPPDPVPLTAGSTRVTRTCGASRRAHISAAYPAPITMTC